MGYTSSFNTHSYIENRNKKENQRRHHHGQGFVQFHIQYIRNILRGVQKPTVLQIQSQVLNFRREMRDCDIDILLHGVNVFTYNVDFILSLRGRCGIAIRNGLLPREATERYPHRRAKLLEIR